MKGLDFETFGEVDLPTYGLDNYIKHPSFRPLLASVASTTSSGFHDMTRFDLVTAAAYGERRALTKGEREREIRRLQTLLKKTMTIAAHNASFERAVLDHMKLGGWNFQDSAVLARAVGGGSKLEAAAPQLVDADKMPDGLRLIKKFSVPQADGFVYVDHVDQWTDEDWADWALFGEYCDLDASLSLQITDHFIGDIPAREWRYELITQQMNDVGWFVDLDLVKAMARQRDINTAEIERRFRVEYDPDEKLNFRSTPQLRAWCKERGISLKSFDEQNVAKAIRRIDKRILALIQKPDTLTPRESQQLDAYSEVIAMLHTKQALGGSSLSKLETIQNLVGPDGRLRNQYLHIGAGQTWRTSGRGVQMQNLKRLPPTPGDVDGSSLDDWTNEDLAQNLRQVFKAEDPDGRLVVGDFSSVESRGLAFLAGARWKLDEFAKGRDMYKVLAASMHHTSYESVTKEQRQSGKVGELSCGYGAGPGAVRTFAEKMHVELDETEAAQIVTDWRAANPEITTFWANLDTLLHQVVEEGHGSARMQAGPNGDYSIHVVEFPTPASLRRQMSKARTIRVELRGPSGNLLVCRYFQGAFMDGRGVCYHKPSELKSGHLWHDHWTKDGQSGRYKVYGGKLAGILTQSFCRELFFRALDELSDALMTVDNATIVGQFHDEIVVEWTPEEKFDFQRTVSLAELVLAMQRAMVTVGPPGFPMEAEIKHAHRYTK